jgi:hypothetical protein
MIILMDGVKYALAIPRNEEMLEIAIEKNSLYVFGEDSFYFNSKTKLKSAAGIGSIPDAYLIIFTPQPKWCILEVELSSHPLYEHVIPQLTKFNRGIEESAGKSKIINLFYDAIKSDAVLEAKIRKKIGSGEIFKFISELISDPPIIVIAIDKKTEELEEAIKDVRGDVRILEFKSFRRQDMPEGVTAYLFTPIFDIKTKTSASIDAPRILKSSGILPSGLKLYKTYKGKEFMAEVIEGQKIKFNGEIYDSVSSAAVAAIRSTGSKRKTEDGWRWWLFEDSNSGEIKPIDELRRRS